MFINKFKAIIISLFVVATLVVPTLAQKGGDNTPLQRLEVLRQKLDTMKRSLRSASSVLKNDKNTKKEDKDNPDTPYGSLVSLTKETSGKENEVNNLRGKISRNDGFEISELDSLERRVSDLRIRVDSALLDTAE